ncbi:MAG: electron transport complex subunit RsxG [Pseudomonadota bacterium]
MADQSTELGIATKLHQGFADLRKAPVGHGVLLGLFALTTALILALVDDLTEAAIAARNAEDLAASLAQVIPADLHDNDVTRSLLTLEDLDEGLVTVYRARMGDEVVGVAYQLTGNGYAGGIETLIGVAPDGTLLGVRVLSHMETPGLGDKIEAERSDWITRFTGLSLLNPKPERWKVDKDGGDFDAFSGATITPRTVVGTVRRGLELFARHEATLLAPGVEPVEEPR